MKTRLFLPACASVLLYAACNGQVLPIAENEDDSGANHGGQSGGDRSGALDVRDGGSAVDSALPPIDGGSASCGDAGGNSCLCGELVCVDGQWTCTSCPIDGGAAGCPACKQGEVCVRDQVAGGALFPVD